MNHEIEPQGTVLGWALLNGIDGVLTLQRMGVNEKSFTEINRNIWIAMQELSAKNVEVDSLTIIDHLRWPAASDEAKHVLLMPSTSGVFRQMNIQHWVDIINEGRTWRSIDHWLNRAAAAAKERGDLDEFIARMHNGVQTIVGEKAQANRISLADEIDDYLSEELVDDIMTAPVPTGSMKRFVRGGGGRRGNLIILGGAPGAGKTAFSLNWAKEAQGVHDGAQALFFSLEMTARELATRYHSLQLGVPEESHRDEQWKAVAGSQPRPRIEVVERLFDINQISADAEMACKQGDVRLVVVDHIQAVRAPGTKGDVERMDHVASRLKELAKRAGVPVLAISHLNNNRDQFRGSGMINAYADLSLVMNRPDLESGGRSGSNRVVVRIDCKKQRNGPTGANDVFFEMPVYRFLDMDQAEQPY